jgi:hypothetical protein
MKQKLSYILTGSLCMVVAAGVSYLSGNIWAGYLTAVITGVLYLIILDRTFIQSLEKPNQKLTLRIIIVLLVLSQLLAAYAIYDMSRFQQDNLAKTRTSIDEGVSKVYTQKLLLDTLEFYYNQTDKPDASIASSFREVMGDQLQPDGTILFFDQYVNRDITFRYEIPNSDKVIIRASAKIGKGQDPGFVNVNSETGKYQAVATVTPDGIEYEREN